MKRYSVPGVPMLYLGGSVYICWEEMGRPPFDQIQLSAFWTKDGIQPKLLDFGHRPCWLLRFVQDPSRMQADLLEFVVSYLVCWPLLAVSSIKARYRDDPFVPEYILPQMILQWISATGDFDGIRYFSCHVDMDLDGPRHTCNFVFPPKSYPAAGQCSELLKMFDWTAPLPWQLLDAAQPSIIHGQCFANFQFVLYPGADDNYADTKFGQIQSQLNELAVLKHEAILKREFNF